MRRDGSPLSSSGPRPGPTASGETGLFNVITADTLRHGDWSFGVYYQAWDLEAAKAPFVIGAGTLPAVDDADLRAAQRFIAAHRANTACDGVVLCVKRSAGCDQGE